MWATAQSTPARQRARRYHPDSTAHPAKMLPAIAAHAITHYTRPGDLVLNPMCGIGTIIVQALHAGRRALGVEYEQRWANIDLAQTAGIDHDTPVFTGDARKLSTVLPETYRGTVDLIITSPPYGDPTHGHVTTGPGKASTNATTATVPSSTAATSATSASTAYSPASPASSPKPRPGGHIVITARPWRQHAELVNLPAYIITCGTPADLIPVERCVALLDHLADGDLIALSSFFQRTSSANNAAQASCSTSSPTKTS
ncbi:TRM11 family SAM-dependent methyltransferase [Nocardia salmonicida]|uniref:TRM11 family SAM-dependent methyltransferase n=1 Tax=Nocardia salmonicida TaxID=53431 RepID=UPI003797C487